MRSAGMYSFKISGTGKPGKVVVRVLDGEGRVVGRVMGQTGGTCPGKPYRTTFADLGFSKSSTVQLANQNKAMRVKVECGRGTVIEFTLANP